MRSCTASLSIGVSLLVTLISAYFEVRADLRFSSHTPGHIIN